MIKKITLLIFLILSSVAISLGQVASLENKAAVPNSPTSVELTVAGITNINSFTLKIGFSDDVLDFAGLSNQGLLGMTSNVIGNTIIIAWTSTTAATPPSLLCKLLFYYKGGSTGLAFLPGCEITQGANPIIIGYLNGSVTPAPCLPSNGVVTLTDAQCASGSPFIVPVSIANMPTAGSFTLNIAFDPAKFTFANIVTSGTLAGALANVSNGIITIAWSSPGGSNINTSAFNYLKINFMCNMPGNSTISVAPGSVFTTTNASIIPVCFHNGNVSQMATSHFAKIDTITGVSQGDFIHLPLILNITEPVGAFTLHVDFNSPVLSFSGIEVVDPLASMVTYSVTGQTINLTYFNTAGVPLTGTFLKFKLHYNGIGAGNIKFTGACQFDDIIAQPVNVSFINGYIAPGLNPDYSTVEIGSLNANVYDIVDIPVTIDGGLSNPIRAATMFIGYDNTKLAFIGAVDQQTGTVIDNIGDRINIAWADATGVTFNNSVFLKLRFKYLGGGSTGCGSEIYFTNDILSNQACELANGLAVTVPANWLNGGLNLYPENATIVGQANPIIGSTIAYSTESGKMNYSWSLSGGGSITSGLGMPSITVLWNSTGSSTLSVHYHNSGGCYLGTDKLITVLPSGLITNLEGYVSYDNASHQGMNGVNISLYNSLGGQVGSTIATTTNGSTHGYYVFNSIPEDYYTMGVSTTAAWAGIPYVSGLDALLVELHTAGIYPLSGIRLLAANVNTGSTVNATDALLIKKRIIGEISSFPAGDWVFDNGVINCFSSPLNVYNFKGICRGDVNGSYDPVVGVKAASKINVLDQTVQTVSLNTEFKYSLLSGGNVALGAITIYLNYDPGKVEIKSVDSPFDGLEYSIQNGKISAVWSNAEGKMINENDRIISFNMILKDGFDIPECPFSLSSGCEVADPMANIIDNMNFKMSKLTRKNAELSFAVLPNPVISVATLNFSLPSDGKVKIELADVCGKKVLNLTDAIFQEGDHYVTFDINQSNLTSGIYFATLRYETDQQQITKVIKLIIRK